MSRPQSQRVYFVTVATVDRLQPTAEPFESGLEFETLLADLSSRFVHVKPGEVDREIEDALRRVCEFVGIDLAVLWQWTSTAPGDVVPTHAYCIDESLRPLEPMREDQYPWAVRQVLAGRMFVIASLEDFPAEAAVDRETCLKFGIKAEMCLPLAVGGEPPIGALGLNSLFAERRWPDALVKRLQLVAQVFTNALSRRRADLALRESEEVARATFEQAGVGIAHAGTDGRLLRVNDRLCAIVGYPREELLQLAWQDITHPDDLKADLDSARRVLSGEIKSYSMEKRYIRKDRSLVWIDLTVSLLRTASDEPKHLIAVVEDITERKGAEDALRLSQGRLAGGAELAGLGFFEVDYRTGTVFADDRFRALTGVPEDRRGLQIIDFWKEHLHPEDAPRVLDARHKALDGQLDQYSVEYRYLHPAGGETWIQHIGRPATRDASGHAVKTFGVLRDITDPKQREEALRQSFLEIKRLKDRLQAESDYLKAEIGVVTAQGEITGQSAAIQNVLRQVRQVAPTDSSVLVLGETGTGKELVAQQIHRLSPRQRHVMVKVNCAALPSGLVESELFGREKGAYTGALTRQVGRFELADGSTLFLDEIGELSLDLQAKLLRVLEAGEFERLGSPRTIKVNVRVIAATNRDLAEAIRLGRFREDLYYRLNVFPIQLPPLRERTDDIPSLVWAILAELNARMGKKITQVPRKTLEALQHHRWPGNVRELRNVLENGAIVTTGDTLRVPLLEATPSVALAPQTLADAERALIVQALERAGWHVRGRNGAAAGLGLNPSTLRSRMKKLGIQPRPSKAGDAA